MAQKLDPRDLTAAQAVAPRISPVVAIACATLGWLATLALAVVIYGFTLSSAWAETNPYPPTTPQHQLWNMLDQYVGQFSGAKVYAIETQSPLVPDGFYYGRGAGDSVRPASVTKIVTVYLALDLVRQGRLSLTTPYVIPNVADSRHPSYGGGNSAFLRPGTNASGQPLTATLDFLIRNTMVRSANDAAVMLGYLVAKALGLTNLEPGQTSPDLNASSNKAWFNALGNVMTITAQQLAGSPGDWATQFCTPAGFNNTGVASGCSSRTTPRNMIHIANGIAGRLGSTSGAYCGGSSTLLSCYYGNLLATSVWTDDFNGRSGMTRLSTTCSIVAGMPVGSVEIAKTGTVDDQKALLVVARLPASGGQTDACAGRRIEIAVFLPPSSGARYQLVGGIFERMTRMPTTTGNACMHDYNTGAISQACGSAVAQVNPDAALSAQLLNASPDADAASFEAMPLGTFESGAEIPEPPRTDVNIGGAGADECTPADREVQDAARDYSFTTVAGAIHARMDYMIHEQLMASGCFGQFIEMIKMFRQAADMITTAAASSSFIAAAISLAVRAVVNVIVDQVMNMITSIVCAASDAVYNYLDSAVKNLMCMPPLFTNTMDPLDINLNLTALSCDGVAIDLTALGSNDPNAPIMSGGYGGVNIDVRRADLEAAGIAIESELPQQVRKICNVNPVCFMQNGNCMNKAGTGPCARLEARSQ
ncbi:MAG: serine hydrolase [Bdellovibrionales bacterium]